MPTKFQDANRKMVAGDASGAVQLFVEHALEVPADAAKSFTKAAKACLRLNVVGESTEVVPGLKLVSAPDTRNAEIYFRRALAAQSNYVPALLGLADLLPDDDEKMVLLEQAVSVRPDLVAFLKLGRLTERAGHLQQAYDWYRKAQAHDPLDKTAYDGLQNVCRASGREPEAQEWAAEWTKAYARKPRVSR